MIKLADLDVAVLGFGYLKTLNHWMVYLVTDRGRAIIAEAEQQAVAEIHAKKKATRQRVNYLGDLAATPLPHHEDSRPCLYQGSKTRSRKSSSPPPSCGTRRRSLPTR